MKASSCKAPMVLGDFNTSVNGMFIGCLPVTSLLQSSLACFYNETCILEIQTALELTLVNFTENFIALDPTVSSRFEPTTPLETIIKSLMIEEWRYVFNYSSYFDECKLSTCTYTSIERNSFLDITLRLLGLCKYLL